jgi:hypothetical protein
MAVIIECSSGGANRYNSKVIEYKSETFIFSVCCVWCVLYITRSILCQYKLSYLVENNNYTIM